MSGRWPWISARTLREIFQKARLNSTNGYDKDEAADAVIECLATRLDTFDVESARDRARKAKAEADNVELDNAEKGGEIKRRLEQVAMQIGVEFRKRTTSAAYIPLESRKRLLKEFSEVEVNIPRAKK